MNKSSPKLEKCAAIQMHINRQENGGSVTCTEHRRENGGSVACTEHRQEIRLPGDLPSFKEISPNLRMSVRHSC